MARYLMAHFATAHQQVGSFEVVNEFGALKKNGGNVASYFCTPDGRVIHAVTGPVPAAELLAAAKWAVDVYEKAKSNDDDLAAVVTEAHRRALYLTGRAAGQKPVHQLLAARSLPPLNEVYRTVFENLLGQRVSRPNTDLARAEHAFEAARRAKLPIVLILHKTGDNRRVLDEWERRIGDHALRGSKTLKALARSYVVVALPLKELPALSHQLKVEPYAAPDGHSPLFVVARSDGRQLGAVTTWEKADELVYAMAQGVAQEAKEHPRTPAQLNALVRQLAPIDVALAGQVRKLLKVPGGTLSRAS